MKNIAILYSELAGYTLSCIKKLKENYDVKILLIAWEKNNLAPFQFDNIDYVDIVYSRNRFTPQKIESILNNFQPDGIYISGWMDKGYLKAVKGFKNRGIPVIAGVDGQWINSVRQIIASSISKVYLHSIIDILWVTGERQAQFAKRLGYQGDRLMYGLYSCDWDAFADIYKRRKTKNNGQKFLYVGRLIDFKGIDTLLTAYKRYRRGVRHPWELHIAGTGDLESEIQNVEGIKYQGFVQPGELPLVMADCSAFILPSVNEPWGVVIHEATAAGMPVICSDVCGAGVHLVQDGYNGYIFQSGNVDHLTSRMIQMSSLDNTGFHRMGEASFELSKQFTPDRWADTLINGIERFKKNK